MTETTVVVGYDKSPNSERAVAEAARAALAAGSTLTVVHAYRWQPPITPIAVRTDDMEKAVREAAGDVAEEAAPRGRARPPDLKNQAAAVEGHPATGLADASHGAALLFVGNRGHGGFTGLLLGSVSQPALA